MEAHVAQPITNLGPATPTPDELREVVAAQLDTSPAAITDPTVDDVSEVAYDIPAITTASRHWVRGHATTDGTAHPFAFFVKVVQSWARSPFFAMVPPHIREMAEASVPWRSEPAAYRSDLRDRLPEGLTMPVARGVYDLDDRSAALWLDVVTPDPGTWDDERYARAARLLGRLAGSPRTREVAQLGDDIQRDARAYYHGRVANQVLPAVLGDDIWQGPLVRAAFDDTLRERLQATARATEALADELAAMPRFAAHGDACPNNLLITGDGFTLIDFTYWSPQPAGFDLSQLVLGDVQIGTRPADGLAELDALCLDAYVEGLRDEGDDTPASEVERAHALQMWLYSGISAPPFEMLDAPVTPGLQALADARASIASFALDRVGESAG